MQLRNLLIDGAFCQCDVVIRSGTAPRESLTIVEVQKRGRAVEVNTFRGWCEKLRQVGAQHLICVSTVGFPRSVVMDAQLRGPTVRLITLREIEQSDRPRFAFALTNTYEIVRTSFDPNRAELIWPTVAPPGGPTEIAFDARVLQLASGGMATPAEITRMALRDQVIATKPVGVQPLRFTTRLDQRCLRYVDGHISAPVQLRCSLDLYVQRITVPLTGLSYEQTDIDGAIAWAMVAEGDFGQGPIALNMTYVPAPDGRLLPGGIDIVGIEEEAGYVITAGRQRLSVHKRDGQEFTTIETETDAPPSEDGP